MFIKTIKTLILYCTHLWVKSRDSKIIFYHDVHLTDNKYTDMSTSITVFKSHIDEIRQNGFEIVHKIENKKNQIQICFDDGFKGIYDNKDYFIKEAIFPKIFLAIYLIGQEGYLSEAEIVELQSLGFHFESHAYSHLNLVSFTDEQLEYELGESKLFLEKLLKKTITEICFPIGYFSERVYNFSLKAGYSKMHSSIPGNYFQEDWNGVVNRNLVQFFSPKEVKFIIFGALIPFRNHYKKRQFLKETTA
jgi:hypothetical protein